MLCGTTIALLAVARPFGEFPINDDWSYAWSVRQLCERGELRLGPWVAMTLVGQVIWAWPFAAVAGFSFTALRLSTIAASLIAILGFHALALRDGGRRDTAAAAAVLLAVNPIFFFLSTTFMTDVPFVAAAVPALLGYGRALATGERRSVVAATAWSLVAVSVRQVGLALPLSYAITAVVCRPRDRRVAMASLGAAAAAYAAWLVTARATGVAAAGAVSKIDDLATVIARPALLAGNLISHGVFALLMVSLFLAPFHLLFGPDLGELARSSRRRSAWVGAATFATALAFLLGKRRVFPLLSSVLFDLGLGPLSFPDVAVLHLPHWPAAPRAVWWALMLGAALAAAVHAAVLADAGARLLAERRAGDVSAIRARQLFAALAGLLLLLPVLPMTVFDRYLLLPLLLALYVTVIGIRDVGPGGDGEARTIRAIGALLTAATALFSVAATHDYFSANRARFAALDDLVASRHVAPRDIDGGWEWNGWHLEVDAHATDGRAPWDAGSRYAVALGPMPGFRTIAVHPFDAWIGRSPRAVLVLEREGGPPP